MKTCPYCGKEYPDDAVRCPVDDELLQGDEAGLPLPPETVAAGEATPVIPGPEAAPSSERQTRIFELMLVCVIAFSSGILYSAGSLFDESIPSGSTTKLGWTTHAIHEGSALCLLWYILRRRGTTFADLGLSWSLKGALWSVLLYVSGEAAFYGLYGAIYYSGATHVSLNASSARVGQLLFSGGVPLIAFLFQFLNPFYEELIVRAYVMTEVKHLTQNASMAVLVSTALQVSYHFYQGVPAALAHGGAFLLFSLYYARTNRIGPVILAHLYGDLIPTLRYLLRV